MPEIPKKRQKALKCRLPSLSVTEMQPQCYIGIMSGTSMDGDRCRTDSNAERSNGNEPLPSFLPYSDGLRQELLAHYKT